MADMKEDPGFDLEGTLQAIALISNTRALKCKDLPSSVWKTMVNAERKLDKEVAHWLNPDRIRAAEVVEMKTGTDNK